MELVQGALAQAVPVLERAIGLCETWDLRVIHRTTALALGLAYALSGRLPEALSFLEEAEAREPAIRIFDTSTARTALCTGYLLAKKIEGRRDRAAPGRAGS